METLKISKTGNIYEFVTNSWFSLDSGKNLRWNGKTLDLCSFVRLFIYTVLLGTVLYFIGGFLLLSAIALPYFIIDYFWFSGHFPENETFASVFVVFGIIIWLCTFLLGALWLQEIIQEAREEKRRKGLAEYYAARIVTNPPVPREPNEFVKLVTAYYKAWEGKYCPLIEVVDNDRGTANDSK